MPTLTSPLSQFSSVSPHCPTYRLNQKRKRGSGFMIIENKVMVIISFLCQEGCGADDAHYYPFTVPSFICIDKEREILAPWSYTRNRHGDNVPCLLIQEGDCGDNAHPDHYNSTLHLYQKSKGEIGLMAKEKKWLWSQPLSSLLQEGYRGLHHPLPSIRGRSESVWARIAYVHLPRKPTTNK